MFRAYFHSLPSRLSVCLRPRVIAFIPLQNSGFSAQFWVESLHLWVWEVGVSLPRAPAGYLSASHFLVGGEAEGPKGRGHGIPEMGPEEGPDQRRSWTRGGSEDPG